MTKKPIFSACAQNQIIESRLNFLDQIANFHIQQPKKKNKLETASIQNHFGFYTQTKVISKHDYIILFGCLPFVKFNKLKFIVILPKA